MSIDPSLQFLISIIIALLGTGLQMTQSKLIGVGLIIFSLGWLWWLLFPLVADKYRIPRQSYSVWIGGGWAIVILLGIAYGWWIIDAAVQPSLVSSINQSGGITANSVIINEARRIPRHLTQQQKTDLIRRLRGKDEGRFITVKTTDDTPLKDFNYAGGFIDVFKEAGWTIGERVWGWWYLPIENLAIRSRPGDTVAVFLQSQFKAVGIKAPLIETEEVEKNNIDVVVGPQS